LVAHEQVSDGSAAGSQAFFLRVSAAPREPSSTYTTPDIERTAELALAVLFDSVRRRHHAAVAIT
jgi:hypothetical protein